MKNPPSAAVEFHPAECGLHSCVAKGWSFSQVSIQHFLRRRGLVAS